MSAPFKCEVCNYGRDVPDDYAGHRVKCPQCAAIVQIPQNGTAPFAMVEAPKAPLPEKPCPFCIEPIKVGARKCRWCGEIVDRSLAISMQRAEIEQIQRKQQILLKYLPGARASFVCGLLSVLLSLVLGGVLGPIAILLGFSARNESKKNPRLEGKGLATAGIILGFLGIAATILFFVTLKAYRDHPS